MTPAPPAGSRITLKTVDADPVIVVPSPSGGIMRYGIGLFVLAWLGGWVFGFGGAASQLAAGNTPGTAKGFLAFWLVAWTVGGVFAVYYAYRAFRPPIPETLTLKRGSVLYDSGIPALQMNYGYNYSYANQREAWRAMFPKRTIVEIDRRQLETLRLRETDTGNRLTVDANAARIDLAATASEIEREWLYRTLASRYSLPAPAA
jgi:hypothetical protein